MNSDQIINQSATRSTMVQVLIDQNYCFMENPREKMPFCRYELGPFSSSFMRWPVSSKEPKARGKTTLALKKIYIQIIGFILSFLIDF